MADPSGDESRQGPSSTVAAFILFHPGTEGMKEQVSYNVEARRALTGTNPSVDIPSLCARWKNRLDERLARSGDAGDGFIDLFLLERICPDTVNLHMISRCWSLNHREQDIVRLLLSDRSNKEIAHGLELSPNTVKGYLKLLMRKLDVSSRAGIITRLFTGKNPSSPLP